MAKYKTVLAYQLGDTIEAHELVIQAAWQLNPLGMMSIYMCTHVPTARRNQHNIYMHTIQTSANCIELPSQTRVRGNFLPIE